MASVNDLQFRGQSDSLVFPSAARTVTENSSDVSNIKSKGVRLYLDITASAGGSPTLDLKVQAKDSASGGYFDIPGAAFTQKVTTGTDSLVIYPSVTVVANQAISETLSKVYRVVATIGGSGPSFTFTVNAEYVD